MSEVLPLETLQSVKDLTLRLGHEEHKPQWPDSWNQLTSMTRLELDCPISRNGELRALLPFGTRSLRDVEVTAHFEMFDCSGEEYLFFLIGSLPVLSRLQISIKGLMHQRNDECQVEFLFRIKEGVERLKAICMAVQMRVPGLGYNVFEMRKKPSPVYSNLITDQAQMVITLQL